MRSSLVFGERLVVGVSVGVRAGKIHGVIAAHNAAVPHANLAAVLLHLRLYRTLVVLRTPQGFVHRLVHQQVFDLHTEEGEHWENEEGTDEDHSDDGDRHDTLSCSLVLVADNEPLLVVADIAQEQAELSEETDNPNEAQTHDKKD